MNNQDTLLKEEFEGEEWGRSIFTDHLTSLFNRRYLYRFFPKLIKEAKRDGKKQALFMIDVDDLKRINDTYGHLCGDRVLKKIAEILKDGTRQGDKVGRYAGDEFVILLTDITPVIAHTLAGRIVDNVAAHIFRGEKGVADIHTTVSIGFAVCPDDSADLEGLIDQADKALYLSKQRGKNNIAQITEVTLGSITRMKAMQSFPCSKLVGRETQIFQLKERLKISTESSLQVAFISGEAGIGKSRLLQEFNRYAQSQAIRVINGKGYQKQKEQPYYLLAQSMGSYLEELGPESSQTLKLISKLPAAELRELTQLIPQLKRILGQPAKDDFKDGEEKSLRLFKAFRDLLIELSRESAVMLSFDDIHLADQATMHFICYLANKEKRSRILICGTFCRDQAMDTSLTGKLFPDFCDQVNFHEVALEPLLANQTSEIIETIISGMDIPPRFSRLIHQVSKGNPFFIEEILKSLIESEFVFYRDDQWQMKDINDLNIPSSLGEVIGRRLRILDNETKEMIVQAAVVGEDFDPATLGKIGDKDEGHILELIDRARRMRLITEVGKKGSDKFSFINKQIQDALYKGIDETRKRRLHHQVGELIQNERRGDIEGAVGELSYHFRKSGDQDRAAEYAQMLRERGSELFNRQEILNYIVDVSKKMVMEPPEVEVEIPDKDLKEAAKFITLIQSSITNVLLYPPASKMRMDVLDEAYASLKMILQRVERLSLSEIQGILLVNGRRLRGREFRNVHLESFITLIIDHNIESISFTRGVEKKELSVLLIGLSRKPEDLTDKGGIVRMLREEKLSHIKANVARYEHLSGIGKEREEDKEKLEDMMLMEFLLGKVSPTDKEKEVLISRLERSPRELAKVMTEAVSPQALIKGENGDVHKQAKTLANGIQRMGTQLLGSRPDGWMKYKESLAQAVLALDPQLRSQVIRAAPSIPPGETNGVMERIAGIFSDSVVIDMIVNEYVREKSSLLAVKDLTEKLLFDRKERKKELLGGLKKRFFALGMDKGEFDFIAGAKTWREMSPAEKVGYLLQSPGHIYSSLETRRNIVRLLEELISRGEMEQAGKLVEKLLQEICDGPLEVRENLFGIMFNLVEIFHSGKKDVHPICRNVVKAFVNRFDREDNPGAFSLLLEEFEKMVRFLIKRKESIDYCKLLGELIPALRGRIDSNAPLAQSQKKSIHDCLINVSSLQLVESILCNLDSVFEQSEQSLKNILVGLGEYAVVPLIKAGINSKYFREDSFEGYLWRTKFAGALKRMGVPAVHILREKLSKVKPEDLKYFVEVIGDMQEESLIHLFPPLLNHSDPTVRKEAVIALSKIETPAAINLLTKTFEIGDQGMRRLTAAVLKRLKH